MTTRSCLLLLPCLLVVLPVQALDPCRDQAAKDASDQKALSFFGAFRRIHRTKAIFTLKERKLLYQALARQMQTRSTTLLQV